MGFLSKAAGIALAPSTGGLSLIPMAAGKGNIGTGLKKLTGQESYKGPVGSDPYYEAKQRAGIEEMEKVASGQTPSYAETATRNMLAKNLAAQQAGIRSIGGISGALKQRMVANAAARAGTEMSRSGGEAALSERMQARQALANMLAQARSGSFADVQAQQQNFQQNQAKRAQLAQTILAAGGQAMGAGMSGGGFSPARSPEMVNPPVSTPTYDNSSWADNANKKYTLF